MHFQDFFNAYRFEKNSIYIINVFTITFDQYNASLLNKSITSYKKQTLLTPNV